ncbi:MAG: hypothetical protein HS111_28995 [Kofleriaceae bacterium]|nr:hypothetical protein [Kofleriaceae bacterium]
MTPDAGNIATIQHPRSAIWIDRDQHMMNPSLSGVLVINVFAGRPRACYQRSGFGFASTASRTREASARRVSEHRAPG